MLYITLSYAAKCMLSGPQLQPARLVHPICAAASGSASLVRGTVRRGRAAFHGTPLLLTAAQPQCATLAQGSVVSCGATEIEQGHGAIDPDMPTKLSTVTTASGSQATVEGGER